MLQLLQYQERLIFGIVAISLIVIIALVATGKYKYRLKRKAFWLKFQNTLAKQKALPEEALILKSFFDSLSVGEIGRLLDDRKLFYKRLFSFLIRDRAHDAEIQVNLIDRLFPLKEQHIGITGINDIHIGEPCTLIRGKLSLIGIITDIHKNILSIRLPYSISGNLRGSGKVYIFRPGISGYELGGSVLSASGEICQFACNGKLEISHREHRAVFFRAPVFLRAGKDRIRGEIIKLSERGIVIQVDDKYRPLLREQKTWKGKFPAGGSLLAFRISTIPINEKNRYLGKFADFRPGHLDKLNAILEKIVLGARV